MLPSPALLPGGTAAGSKARRCNARLDTAAGGAAVLWVQLQPPTHPGTVRSSTTAAPCRKAKPSKEQLGQESSYRGSARGVRRRAGAGTGLGSTALLGAGGGTGGPDPAAAGAVARHGDPWHGFRRPAAARTVRVSAPLAVGEQTC